MICIAIAISCVFALLVVIGVCISSISYDVDEMREAIKNILTKCDANSSELDKVQKTLENGPVHTYQVFQNTAKPIKLCAKQTYDSEDDYAMDRPVMWYHIARKLAEQLRQDGIVNERVSKDGDRVIVDYWIYVLPSQMNYGYEYE